MSPLAWLSHRNSRNPRVFSDGRVLAVGKVTIKALSDQRNCLLRKVIQKPAFFSRFPAFSSAIMFA
jgi:hypothetical protein